MTSTLFYLLGGEYSSSWWTVSLLEKYLQQPPWEPQIPLLQGVACRESSKTGLSPGRYRLQLEMGWETGPAGGNVAGPGGRVRSGGMSAPAPNSPV